MVDRAAVIATAIVQITASLPEAERHRCIEALMRDEIADIRREVCADRRIDDDA
jgi:hypothetical protein